jgi:hypothetical protein
MLNFLFQKKKEENNKLLLMASLLGCIATSIIVIFIVKSIFKKFRKKNQTEPSVVDGMDASVEQLVYFNKTGYELMDKALKIDENKLSNLKYNSKRRKKQQQKSMFFLISVINKEGAIEYYRLGLLEFQKGLAIKLKGNLKFLFT